MALPRSARVRRLTASLIQESSYRDDSPPPPGSFCSRWIGSQQEYGAALLDKLRDEVAELRDAQPTDRVGEQPTCSRSFRLS